MGGFGFESLKLGSFVDYIQSIQLITSNGEEIQCSNTENEDLFKFTLCGITNSLFDLKFISY